MLSKIGSSTDCPVIVLTKNGKVLMGYRNYTADKWKPISVWTIPGGRCDQNETLEQTVRRETAEETGITDFTINSFLVTVPGAKDGDIVHIFSGTTDADPRLMEPEKFSEWQWFGPDELPNNFINQETLKIIKQHLT